MADSFLAPRAPQHRPRNGCAAGQGEGGNHPEGRVNKPAHLAYRPGLAASTSPGRRCELRLIGSRHRLIRQRRSHDLTPSAASDDEPGVLLVQPGHTDGQLQRDLAEHGRCIHGPAERDNGSSTGRLRHRARHSSSAQPRPAQVPAHLPGSRARCALFFWRQTAGDLAVRAEAGHIRLRADWAPSPAIDHRSERGRKRRVVARYRVECNNVFDTVANGNPLHIVVAFVIRKRFS